MRMTVSIKIATGSSRLTGWQKVERGKWVEEEDDREGILKVMNLSVQGIIKKFLSRWKGEYEDDSSEQGGRRRKHPHRRHGRQWECYI